MTTPEADEPPARRGRPPRMQVQQAIRTAATALFAERGFGATSVRDIASVAGVDAALVVRHFGSKEALFLQTMTIARGLHGVTDGPLETLGRAILHRLVEEADEPTRAMYAALARSVDRPAVREYLRAVTRDHIVDPLAARLTGRDAELRAWLVAAQVNGLLSASWVLDDPAGSPYTPAAVLDVYALAIQALVDPPTGGRRTARRH